MMKNTKQTGNMPRVVTIDALTSIGPTRSTHEDAIMVAGMVGISSDSELRWHGRKDCVSAAVVDGIGGYKGGADASALIATTLCSMSLIDDEVRMNEIFEAISYRVKQAGQSWGTPDMGAAMAMISIYQDKIVIANVGDSRIYRFVGNSIGVISVDDRADINRPGITQSIGGDTSLDAHVWSMPLDESYYRFILCSDGVWSALGNERLEEICKPQGLTFGDLTKALKSVISACNEAQASDNCSIIVIDVAKEANNE